MRVAFHFNFNFCVKFLPECPDCHDIDDDSGPGPVGEVIHSSRYTPISNTGQQIFSKYNGVLISLLLVTIEGQMEPSRDNKSGVSN